MLETVRVQRFKSIADAAIPFGRVTLLVGPNNAGKSSVLHAIQFAVSVAQSLRLDNVATWANNRLSGTLSAQQLVYTPLRDVQALASGGVLRQDEASAITITIVTSDLGSAEVKVRRGKNKNVAVGIDGHQLGQRLEKLDEPFSVVAPGLAGIPSMEEFRSAGIVRRAAARGDANSVFRNVLWVLKQDAVAWQEFKNNLKLLFEDLDVDVTFNPAIDEHISAFVVRDEGTLPIDSCGTGVLQAVQTLAYIGVYKPRLLILDEPDSHLHPDNQRKLARLLDNLARSGGFQVLISTHSRHLLDEFGRLEATIHWFSGGQIQPDNTDRVGALLSLGALDAGDRLRNGATPFVVLTEDKNSSALKKILASCGMGDDKCEVWSYAGCTNAESALLLAQFIREHAPNTIIVVHRDCDYLTEDEVATFSQRLKESGLHALVTQGTDIESHLLRPDHLATVAQPLSVERLTEIVAQATELARATSIEKFTNSQVAAAQRHRNRTGGGEINYGQIAADAQAKYAANPERFRHGKTVLGRVVALIQQELGHNVQVVQESNCLQIPWLCDLAKAADAPEG
ncbi:MAG: AAA family ATPase [Burkholderiales bacterium]|nr:AAA family ATPase [Burkholderiales bacterium]